MKMRGKPMATLSNFIFNFPFSTVNLPHAAFGNSLRALLAGSIKIPYPSVGLPLTSVVNKGQQNYYFSFSYFN